jgi:hypothetical protein
LGERERAVFEELLQSEKERAEVEGKSFFDKMRQAFGS